MKNKKIIITIFFFCMVLICKNLWATRVIARDKWCFSNIRVIQGAVEMYNMDVETMMHKLDMNILLKGKYLKSELSKPETSCEYTNIGDLSGYGFVFCKYHGDSAHLVYCEYYKDNKYDQYEKLSQNATEEDIRLNGDRIRKEREMLFKIVELREKTIIIILIICIPLSIIFLIKSAAPSRKKSN